MPDPLKAAIEHYAAVLMKGTGDVPAVDVAWKLRQILTDPNQGVPDAEVTSSAAVTRRACPHCDPDHGDPRSKPWGVYVGPERDGDGQSIALHVMPSNGAHVAESDAAWLWELIRTHGSGSTPPGESVDPVSGRPTARRAMPGRLGRGA